MTADAEVPVVARGPATTGPRVDLFLLAGQFPEAGAKRLLLMVEGAGDPDLTLANIARLGTEVLPALWRTVTSPAPRPDR
ncbi:MAG TPA: hypothetical protein VGP31_12845 [Planosporangium sp.]|nr:hypothetical protein [Planosporangium sp.]